MTEDSPPDSESSRETGGTSEVGSGDDGSETDLAPLHSLWVRWPDVRPEQVRNNVDDLPVPLIDIHLHRFCDLLPSRGAEPDVDVEFRFLDGPTRWVVRFIPTVVLLVTVGLLAYAEYSPTIQGVSVLLPPVPRWAVTWLLVGAVLWGGIAALSGRVGIVEMRELSAVVVVWGLVAALFAGASYSAYRVLSASNPAALPPNVVYLSGYLLLILVGGMLVYDGMLRTETLLEGLPDGNESIVEDETGYEKWRDQLQERLRDDVFGVPTSHVVALLFVLQFAAVWTLGTGPQALSAPVTLAVNLGFDFLLVVVAFRFLVLVNFVNLLMTDQFAPEGERARRVIRYEPFHYDRRGGFRDFGRFATRVNVLLLVGGVYTVFRLYVQGLRTLPDGGLLAFGSPVHAVLWACNFLLPFLAYALASGAWVYYSFWAIHRKMVTDKRILCATGQGTRGGDGGLPTVGDSIDDFEGGPDWFYLSTAPEWPIDSTFIVSVVSANAVPLLVPLLRFLF